MENIATSVRVAGDAISVLSKLADKLGQSKAQVIQIALKELEERIFWDEVGVAFEQVAADPVELSRQRAEFNRWDESTSQDLKGEEW